MGTNYTIAQGDCLWNIAKAQYGDQLKSNGDILKAVNEIAAHNNMQVNDYIYAGNNLELPDLSSLFGPAPAEEQTEQTQAEEQNPQTNIYSDYSNWQDMHADNMENLIDGSVDENTYLENESNIGTSFNFMQGQDVENKEAYDAQTLALGQGEVEQKDSDNDGTVDFSEYFSTETAEDITRYKEMIQNGEIDKETVVNMIADAFLQSKAVFQIIDEAMGDGSGELDETELQKYYQHLDEFVDGSGETNRDGQIDLDAVTDYPQFLANQIQFSDSDYATAYQYAASLFADM